MQNSVRKLFVAGGWAMLSVAAFSPANAGTFDIAGRVQPFCQVRQEPASIHLTHGKAALGPITELCNVADGYRVTATFANLIGGKVNAGDDTGRIGQDGTLVFMRTRAQRIQKEWFLSDAIMQDVHSPVTLQVNVSPL